MHRFTIIKGNDTYTIDINNVKMLVGDNYHLKYDLYYQLKNYFNKINNSNFSIENSNKRIVKFDESPLDVKQWIFVDINPYFDIENDLKLGTKSLTNKYLNSFNDSLERNEIFNTLSILVNSLNVEFFEPETDLIFGDKKLQLRLGDISRPIIYKEIIPNVVSKELDCNSGDFNYEDTILLQLALVSAIASKNINNKILAFCNIPIFTKRIKLFIYGMKYNNLFVIINSNEIIDLNIDDFCIVSKKHYLDMANEEMILDKMMDFPFHIEKEVLINGVKTRLLSDKLDANDSLNIELFTYKI